MQKSSATIKRRGYSPSNHPVDQQKVGVLCSDIGVNPVGLTIFPTQRSRSFIRRNARQLNYRGSLLGDPEKGSVYNMKHVQIERCLQIGNYIIEHNATIRETAKAFNISKSSVHVDVQERLRKTDNQLYKDVRKIIERNKAEWHKRGGEAFAVKYFPDSRKNV